MPKLRFTNPLLTLTLLIVLIALAGGSLFYYQGRLQKADKTPIPLITTSSWKTYSQLKDNYSFSYPSSMRIIAAPEDVSMLAITKDPAYTFPTSVDTKPICTSGYIITTDGEAGSLDDFKELIPTAYLDQATITSTTINSSPALIVTGKANGNNFSSLFVPNGATTNMAVLQNGNQDIIVNGCGTNQDTAEFKRVVTSFALNNNKGVPTPTPLAAQRAQSELLARDSQRSSDLNNLNIAAQVFKDSHGHFPIHTTCTDVATLKSELSSTNVPASVTLSYSDPKVIKGAALYDASWPNYCYQSDATGSRFMLWARAEADAHAGEVQVVGVAKYLDPFFIKPLLYSPNAIYAQYAE